MLNGDNRVNEIIGMVVEIVEKYIPKGRYKLYLFGSRAKGTNSKHSDIDLAIESDELDNENFHRIKSEIENINTLYTIDLVDINAVDKDFKELINKNKLRIDEQY